MSDALQQHLRMALTTVPPVYALAPPLKTSVEVALF